ncbi:4-fold beta flower protein [Pararhizobium sp. LjRoot235]|uniref:4-fold beta flower protein n=1 Tax=Pararhizobium sp. LjRoot235 TaxID=3342291 RepID=UPI003F50A5F6
MDFHDRQGRATHYINPNGVLYTWKGKAVGKLHGENLYNNAGRQIGRITNGWLRDTSGKAVAFTKGASGGPIPPIPQIPAIKGIPAIPPIPAIPAIPRIPAIPSLSWSNFSIDDLLNA